MNGGKASKFAVVVQAKLVAEAAQRTEGFSGRELAKLMASVQAAAYGTPNATLTEEVRHPLLLFSDLRLHSSIQ